MSSPWLTARLTHIVLVNYRVPASLLLPYVPRGSELDTPERAPDLHLLSLVALRLSRARLYGLPIPLPTARSLPQLNLRFYVRRGPMRAVVFLRELVSAPLVVLGARLLYSEPYHLASLSHRVEAHGAAIVVRTHVEDGPYAGEILVRARDEPLIPAPDSVEHFLKQRHWSFYRTRSARAFRYRLSHPIWRTYPIETAAVNVDPGALLGPEWQVIDWPSRLHSVIVAEGSPATLYLPEALDAPPD